MTEPNTRDNLRVILILNSFLFLFFGFLTIFAVFQTSIFIASMEEDRWVEWATFYAFLVSFGFFALCFTQFGKNDEDLAGWGGERAPLLIQKVMFLGLALFCLFVAGEEISWGQRLLAFKPPDLFLEKNYQQELNFHNFLKDKEWAAGPIKIDFDTKYLVAYIAIFYGVLFPITAFLLSRWKRELEWIRNVTPSITFIPWFIFIAWVELTYPIKFAGEAAELALGILFLSDSLLRLSAIRSFPIYTHQSFPIFVMGFVFLLGAATTWAIDRFHFGSSDQGIAQASAELELMRKDLLSGKIIQVSLLEGGGIHKRIYTAVESGYIRFGSQSLFLENQSSQLEVEKSRARTDRRGYFLDPWNNPYWISYRTKNRLLIVYSMGPNRRRDTHFSKLSPDELAAGRFEGDDIRVGFVLPEKPSSADH
ncbi:MAG: hypothetical protein AAB317_04120 [Nitrospirota bacterium]